MLSLRRSSCPRDRIHTSHVSCMGMFCMFFTTWEAPRHMNISGFGDPRGIYRTIPQRKLKNDFTISKKTWVYILTILLLQGFLRSDKCHGSMKDYVNNTSKSVWQTQPMLAIFSPQMNGMSWVLGVSNKQPVKLWTLIGMRGIPHSHVSVALVQKRYTSQGKLLHGLLGSEL